MSSNQQLQLSVFLDKEDQTSRTGGRIYLPKYVMVFLLIFFFVSVDAHDLSSPQFSVLSGSFPGLNQYYNAFNVYRRELALGTVSLTGDRAQGNDSKHWAYSKQRIKCLAEVHNTKSLQWGANPEYLNVLHPSLKKISHVGVIFLGWTSTKQRQNTNCKLVDSKQQPLGPSPVFYQSVMVSID